VFLLLLLLGDEFVELRFYLLEVLPLVGDLVGEIGCGVLFAGCLLLASPLSG